MPTDPLDHLDLTEANLLRLAFDHVDASMLREIAEADYGMDADAHLEALRAVRAGDIATAMAKEPKEVLELIRWSEPEDPGWKPGSPGVRGHWMRLFSCAVLIRAAAEPEGHRYITGEESTVAQLVGSALALGADTSAAALRFLCWRIRCRALDEEVRPYIAVGILLLAEALGRLDSQTAQFLIASADSGDLALSDLIGQCQKADTWRAITRRVLVDSDTVGEDLQRFGRALLGGTRGA